MGPFLFLYVALVGFFAFAAIYHCILWASSRRETLLAVFSVDCAVRAAVSGAIVAVAISKTPAEAHEAIAARVGLGMVMMVTWLWSLSLVSGVRARWFVWPITVTLLVLIFIHAFVMPLNSAVLSVEQAVMPWGETISNPQLGPSGWWVGPSYLLGVMITGFGMWCGASLWIRDRSRIGGALIVTSAVGTLLVFVVELLRSYGKLSVPFIGVLPQVFWVCAIAFLIAREHRRTRERLAGSEQRFRGIFDQTFQFIGLMTTDGTLIEANRTALEFAGISEKDVIGKPFWETPWWKHSPELQSRLRAATGEAAAGKTVRFEGTHPRPDGRLAHVDFSLKPIRNEEGQITLLIPEGRDITEQKDAEERKRALEHQLAQAQKMEAIGQLAGGVAHDFNNLLTVINGYSELLQSITPADDVKHGMLSGIHDAGERAAVLSRQLLTFSRQQVVEPRALDLNAVVVDTEKMLRRLIGEDIRLTTILHPTLARIMADPGQMGQVIMNLAINARHAMPTGGDLTIETANVELSGAVPAMHRPVAPGSYVMIVVTDTGYGMSPDIQARIFDPFFTTKGPGKGTGLGLATVRTIVEDCGGGLRVHSEPGRGSSFQVYLPALDVPLLAESPASIASTLPSGHESILLVEDDDAVRSFTRRILQKFGYVVMEMPGGAEAISFVEQHSGPIDLLITDVVMPGIGGAQLVERLRLLRADLRILYLSGYTNDAVVRHGVMHADVAFLQKPFTLEALASKVRQTLDAQLFLEVKGPPSNEAVNRTVHRKLNRKTGICASQIGKPQDEQQRQRGVPP